MKIGTIVFIVMIMFALIVSIFGASYHYIENNKAIEKEVDNHLESVAQSKANNIESILDNEKVFAQELALIGKVERVLLDPSEDRILAINKRLQKTVDSNDEIIQIDIVNKSGIIIAGTDSNALGIDKSKDSQWSKLNNGEIAISEVKFPLEGGNKPVLSIASPVKSNNEIIGFIFITINIEKLNEITLDKTGMGNTGESYLVNKEGYAITPLLFVEDAPLKWKVDSINSRNCFSHENEKNIEPEEVKTFLGYTGNKVIGTNIYIPEMKWCLLVEVNEEEVLGSQRKIFQKVIFIIIISTTLLASLVGFFLGKFIDKRVVLKKGKKLN